MTCSVLCLLISIIVNVGCASTSQVVKTYQAQGIETLEGATIELVKKESRLVGVGVYTNIHIAPFEAPDEYRQDYAQELNWFHTALINDLRSKKAFKEVLEGTAVGQTGKTVNVTGKIVEMRITSAGARIWLGEMAGSSYMTVYLQITDNATGEMLKEKVISTYNNAFGATYSFGSSDRSMPKDMGQIIGAYLSTVIPTE
jgi:hypothetical protein